VSSESGIDHEHDSFEGASIIIEFRVVALNFTKMAGTPGLTEAVRKAVQNLISTAEGIGDEAVDVRLMSGSHHVRARVTLDPEWLRSTAGAGDTAFKRLAAIEKAAFAAALCAVEDIHVSYVLPAWMTSLATGGQCPFQVKDLTAYWSTGAEHASASFDATVPAHQCPVSQLHVGDSGGYCFYRGRGDSPFQLAHWQSLDTGMNVVHLGVPCDDDSCCEQIRDATDDCCGENDIYQVKCMSSTVNDASLFGDTGLGLALQVSGLVDPLPAVKQQCTFGDLSYSCPGTWVPREG
jgi:hypothetical protein